MKRNTIIGISAAIVLVVGGVVAFYLMRPEEPIVEKPTIEEANIILDESIKNTFALTSFTTKGNANFQIKSGEIVLIEVAMRDMQSSVTNPWDFFKLNSEMVVTYDIMLNLTEITDLIEANMPPKEPDPYMLIDPMIIFKTLRAIGVANIAVTMEMKSIDNDSYMKITEITGLREAIAPVAGIFTEMIMGKIEPKMGIWFKTPATPETIEMTKRIDEKIDPLMNVVVKALPDILFVQEVLPNTKVNDIAVYNFTTDIDLNKVRDLIISLIPLIGEMMEIEMMEIDEEEVVKVKQDIKEFWPKVVTVIEAMEINLRTYICQETRLIIKDVGTANINLYRIITTLRPMIIEEMTPEELTEFNEAKETIRNIDISFVITWDSIYSDHNAVPPITPPAEYQLLEELLEDIMPQPEFYPEETIIIEDAIIIPALEPEF